MLATVVERMFSAIFGKAGEDFLAGLAATSTRLTDFVYVKIFGLPFIVLGARQTGKTTLIEWLRRNYTTLGEFQPEPTAPGGEAVGTFGATIGEETMRLKPLRDVGGEYDMWETDWVELFEQARPRGIIFLIDHTDILSHKDALNFIMNLIEEDTAARRNLKGFMLLVNKSDVWLPTTTLDALTAQFANEIKRLRNQGERLGFQTWIHSASVTQGTGVGDAMTIFFNAVRPLPR
jgi:hypothetical protein